MLKNREERMKYISDQENYEIIELPVKFMRLKKTPFVNVQLLMDDGYIFKDQWVSIGTYELKDDSRFKSLYDLSSSHIIDWLTKERNNI